MQRPKNFRDVGEIIQKIDSNCANLISVGKIYRGGQIEFLRYESLGSPSTIINLRMLKDEENFPGVKYLHFPIANNADVYDTKSKDVRVWLNEIFKTFEKGDVVFPVYIHCFAGKDRTGVVIAALLMILGVPVDTIVKEYLSTTEKVVDSDIKKTLNNLLELEKKVGGYYRGINLEKVRKILQS